MLKKIISGLVIVIGLATIVLGYRHYQSKVNGVSMSGTRQSQNPTSSPKDTDKSQTSDTKSAQVDTKLAKNLPADVQSKLETAIRQKTSIKLTLVAQSNLEGLKTLESELKKAYGNSLWQVTTLSYPEATSTQLLSQGLSDQVLATKPDVILFEAPLFKDDTTIDQAESLNSNDQLLNNMASSGASLLVEPSPPIYQGVIYPKQVATFKQQLPVTYSYLDYWSAFPDLNSPDMKKLVLEDGSYYTLNTDGNQLWTDTLVKTFIAH